MIAFYYEISKLISNIRVISDYRAKSEIDRGEQNIIPSVNLVDDPIAEKLLEDAGAEIALIMSGYFDGLVDEEGNELEGYEFDVTYLDEETYQATENCMVFRLNMPSSFNTKLIGSIDRSIKSALENFVLYKFFMMVHFEPGTYEKNYNEDLEKIRYYIHQRTSPIKRAYKLY